MPATRGTTNRNDRGSAQARRVRVVQERTAAALTVGLALGGGAMWVCGAPFAEALIPVGLAWWVAVCAIPARRPGILARLTKNVVSFRCWPGRRAGRKEQIMQATSVQQPIGTMHGHRAIIFTFITTAGRKTVTFDFYGAGAKFNGMRYCEIEASALRAVVQAGLEVTDYSHYITA